MTDSTLSLLNQWLQSGTDIQREHARYRLGIPDAKELSGQPSKSSYPSVWKQAKNAATALVDSALTGFATVDDPERSLRLEICGRCEHLDNAQFRCRLCGCRMNLKSALASQHCPIGKW